MAAAGLPIIPGSPGVVPDEDAAERFAAEIGYPVIIKASEGGGGRGMRIVREKSELSNAFQTARTEAEQAFGSPNVYIEKLIERPRHIEFQVLGDRHGTVDPSRGTRMFDSAAPPEAAGRIAIAGARFEDPQENWRPGR